jgi:DNA-binding CsgD family transcriptional regulator
MARRVRKAREPLEDVELKLLHLVAQGHTNKEIAARIGRSPTAVKALLQRMYQRFWVPNRAALVAYARTKF